jgi:dimethylargininase
VRPVYAFDSAIVRLPPASVVDGLRAGGGAGPSPQGVMAEHRAYVAALEASGLAVETLPPLEDYPDSLFVEDPAFVLPEGAILLRSRAPSRAGETAAIAPVLRRRFERVLDLDCGFADGGDILSLPDEILIGLSARTDAAGAQGFVELADAFGRRARIVATPPGVLHLKSACALLDEETVIATRALAEAGLFDGLEVITVPGDEEGAANLLRVNDVVLLGADYPGTRVVVEARDVEVVPLPVGEIRKIDAGLSCMSLRW